MKKPREEAGKKTSAGPGNKKSFFTDERIKFIIGILITGFALYLLIACIAYIFSWKADQSVPLVSGPEVNAKNWSGKSGHWLSELIISDGFGIGAFFIPLIIGSIGLYLLKLPGIKLWKLILLFSLATIISSLLLGFIDGEKRPMLGG